MEIVTETAQFLFWEYINGIFVAVQVQRLIAVASAHMEVALTQNQR